MRKRSPTPTQSPPRSSPHSGVELDPRLLAAAIVLLLAARAYYGWLLPFAAEDAYIGFRFARHLAEGSGLVFNPGEVVFGFTSAPWTLWTALGCRLGADPVAWTRISSAALDAVTIIGGMQLLVRATSQMAACAFAALFSAWPYFAAVSASGLEMSLVMALLVVGVERMERAPWTAGACLGLLALARPEGAFAAALCLLWAGPRTRAIAAVIAVAGFTALWLTLGSPLPNTVLAKAQAYGLPGLLAGRGWWEWLLPFDLGRIPAFEETRQWWPLRVVALPAAALGAWSLRRSRALSIPLSCLGVTAAYALTGTPFFWWYFALPTLGFSFAAAAGLRDVARGPWIPIAAAFFLAGSWTVFPWTTHRGRAQAEAESFVGVAAYLLENSRPGETALLEPIGHIGWLNPHLRLVDEVGLVAPDVARRRAQGDGWYAETVKAERPAWLVARPGLLDGNRAFAGRGRPFRSEAQRDSVMRDFILAYTGGPESEHALWVYSRRER